MDDKSSAESTIDLAQHWQVPDPIAMSDWAEKNRIVAAGLSPLPGKWSNQNSLWMREIMDTIGDSTTRKIILKMPVQVAKTETLINATFYFIDREPSPILFVLPKKDFAIEFVQARVEPNIQATPKIRKKISRISKTDDKNKTLLRVFNGGFLSFVGSGSPTDLAGRPVRIVIVDELDRCHNKHIREGMLTALVEKRTERFFNHKQIFASTPTFFGHSPIEDEYEKCRQMEAEVPCPECGHYQNFEIEQLKYDLSDDKKIIKNPVLACAKNGCLIADNKRRDMGKLLKWKCAANCQIDDKIGYTTNALTLPLDSLQKLAEEYQHAMNLMEVGKEEEMQVFLNTRLAKIFKPKNLADINPEKLMRLATHFNNMRSPFFATLTNTAKMVITAGVDIQANRCEVVIIGHSLIKENGIYKKFTFEKIKFYGEFADYSVKLQRLFIRSWGEKRLVLMMVDANYKTAEVCNWAKTNKQIIPIVGRTAYQHAKPAIIGWIEMGIKDKTGKKQYKALSLNVNKIKDFIHEKNQHAIRQKMTQELFYSHRLNADFYRQLTAEELVIKIYGGQKVYVWENTQNERNEALDCSVYAYAAFILLVDGY